MFEQLIQWICSSCPPRKRPVSLAGLIARTRRCVVFAREQLTYQKLISCPKTSLFFASHWMWDYFKQFACAWLTFNCLLTSLVVIRGEICKVGPKIATGIPCAKTLWQNPCNNGLRNAVTNEIFIALNTPKKPEVPRDYGPFPFLGGIHQIHLIRWSSNAARRWFVLEETSSPLKGKKNFGMKYFNLKAKRHSPIQILSFN